MAKKKSVAKTVPAVPAAASPVAAKPAARKPAAPKKAALTLTIDYPREDEVVRSGYYAIRLTTSDARQAQVSFDGGPWLDCREASGHFWFDWAPSVGCARIAARARSGKGRWTSIPARSVPIAD